VPSAAGGPIGGEDHRGVAGVVGGGHQQQLPGGPGQPADAVTEDPLEPLGQRQPVVERVAAVELRGGEGRRQLSQRERVAAGERHEAGHHRGRDVAEQRARRGLVERPEHHLGHRLRRRGAGRDQHRDRLGGEPAGGEGERVGGPAVDPLGVVDQAQQRPVPGRLGEQAQRRDRDEVPVTGPARFEGAAQRGLLRARQGRQMGEHRP
jgi:hypothetical protein